MTIQVDTSVLRGGAEACGEVAPDVNRAVDYFDAISDPKWQESFQSQMQSLAQPLALNGWTHVYEDGSDDSESAARGER